MFRFTYSALLHCICCCCRIYNRNRRPRVRRKKPVNQQRIEYVGTTTVDPSWPEAHNDVTKDKSNNDDDNEEITDEENDEESNDVWDRMESRVPVLVVIAIIIAYVCLGAIMFHESEGWTMTESVYFCYITLSTIGFGDYVC
jgi:hypothetical protein